jgi:hypothetical protein
VNEHQLRLRLEALGAGPATADWAEARGRAERLFRRRTRRVVAFAAAAAILVVGPALALATDAIDFWSAEPAHPRVVLLFEALEAGYPAHLPEPALDERKARRILTREFEWGTWTLSVGPRKNGGFCSYVGWRGGGGGDCTDPGVPLSVSVDSIDNVSSARVFGSVSHPDGAYVEIVLRGGRVKRAELTWVSEPIDAAFFLEEIPRRGQLGTVVLREADGTRLASRQF